MIKLKYLIEAISPDKGKPRRNVRDTGNIGVSRQEARDGFEARGRCLEKVASPRHDVWKSDMVDGPARQPGRPLQSRVHNGAVGGKVIQVARSPFREVYCTT